MFRTVPLSIMRSFSLYTQHSPSWSCSQAVSKPVWHIPLLCVRWKTPDDGQRNCPKHVKFYSKNKFEKLVRLVGFIIRKHVTKIGNKPTNCGGSWCSVLGIDARLWAGSLKIVAQFPVGTKDLCLLQTRKTDSGAHRTSYSLGTGTFFLVVKQPDREAFYLQIVFRLRMYGVIQPLTHKAVRFAQK